MPRNQNGDRQKVEGRGTLTLWVIGCVQVRWRTEENGLGSSHTDSFDRER